MKQHFKTSKYAKFEFRPLLFGTNRSICSKYKVSYMILQMKHLPTEVMDGFQEGLFVLKWTQENFNYAWIDYVLEATENKALNWTGWIIKLKRKGHALATLASCQVSRAIPSQCVQRPNKNTNNRNASSFGHNSNKNAVRQGCEKHGTNVWREIHRPIWSFRSIWSSC